MIKLAHVIEQPFCKAIATLLKGCSNITISYTEYQRAILFQVLPLFNDQFPP